MISGSRSILRAVALPGLLLALQPSPRQPDRARQMQYVSISAGADHTCALAANGAVYCWGSNDRGQLGDGSHTASTVPIPVTGGLTFTALSAGHRFTCAITAGAAEGRAYCWGAGDQEPVALPGAARFTAAAAGADHACLLTPAGQVLCWGANDAGQLGDGSRNPADKPVRATGGFSFQAVTLGAQHTCALTTAGAAYCWGRNREGQLGDGSDRDHNRPTPVAGGLTFQALSAGDDFTCGVTAQGAAFCWGLNADGQLGIGSRQQSSRPAAVAGGLVWASLAAGYHHACGLTRDGAAYCWGDGAQGQLGSDSTVRTAPVALPGELQFASLSAGRFHTCGIASDGGAVCWGHLGKGQLGNGKSADSRTAVPVDGGHVFVTISAGPAHTCGITETGAAYCWGDHWYGQLGTDAASVFAPAPVPVAGNLTLARISAGLVHSCGVTTEGAAYCWGQNDRGQLGLGTKSGGVRWTEIPLRAAAGRRFYTIAAGDSYTCGVTATGEVYCWGDNSTAQLGTDTLYTSDDPMLVLGRPRLSLLRPRLREVVSLLLHSPAAAVTAGATHACGLLENGTAFCWGGNEAGQVGNGERSQIAELSPLLLTRFGSLSAGTDRTCGVERGGRLLCWGLEWSDSPRAIGPPTVFDSVSVGERHACAVGGGKAYCWGANEWGQLGTGDTESRAEPTPAAKNLPLASISAGGAHTCGLAPDGAAHCWGRGTAGQLGNRSVVVARKPARVAEPRPGNR